MIITVLEKKQNFVSSTKTSSPTGSSGATSLPPIGDSFVYKETSQNISGNENNFVSFERRVLIQTTNKTFCHNGLPKFLNDSLKIFGRFRIQL